MSEVGVLCRHVNRDRLRALVAEGNIRLSSAVARRGKVPCSGRTSRGARSARTRCGTRRSRCRTCRGARACGGARCARSRCGARSTRGTRASGCLPPRREREHQQKGEGC